MKTKRSPKADASKEKPADNSANLTPSNSAPEPENTALGEGEKRVGVAWYVKQDGTIDLSRMRASTREQLQEFLKNPEVKKTLGLEEKPGEPPVQVFSPDWCGSLYDGVGAIMAVVASRMYKLSLKACQQALAYSEAEKEKLAGPTAAVINKYAPDWLVRFKEEIALAILFGSMTLAKVTVLRMMANAAKEPAAPAAAPNGKTAQAGTTEPEKVA